MAWVTQTPIADRTRERLGESDTGVIMLRRMLNEAMATVADGGDPMNVFRRPGDEPVHRDGAGEGVLHAGPEPGADDLLRPPALQPPPSTRSSRCSRGRDNRLLPTAPLHLPGALPY